MWVACGLAAVLALFAGTALGQDSEAKTGESLGSREPDLDAGGHTTSASRQVLRVAVPIVLTLGMFGFMLAVHLRRKRERTRHSARPRGLVVGPSPVVELREPQLRDSQVTLAAAVAMGELELIEPSSPPPPPQVLSESKRAECPSCGREFDSMLAMCPFDSEKLVPKVATVLGPEITDVLDTSVSYRSCPECGEIFDVGSNFCPYDRTPLEAEDRKHEDEQHELACPECGETFEDTELYCPSDGTPLIHPGGEHHHAMSIAPLLICTRCSVEYPLNTVKCEACENPLTFLHGRRTGGRILTGDTIVQVCPECGERYGEGMEFCTKDGAPLASLN